MSSLDFIKSAQNKLNKAESYFLKSQYHNEEDILQDAYIEIQEAIEIVKIEQEIKQSL